MPQKVVMSERTFVEFSPNFYMSRLLGLAPLSFKSKGDNRVLKISSKFNVYSYLLGLVMIILAIRGMVNDFNDNGIESIKVNTMTSKVVMCVDIALIVFIVIMGISGAPRRQADLMAFYDCIAQIDSIVKVPDHQRARNVSIIFFAILFSINTSLLGLDLYVWHHLAGKQAETEFLIENYVPFYLLYYIILMLECQYWQATQSTNRRFGLLNSCLKNFKRDETLGRFLHFNEPIDPRKIAKFIDVLARKPTVSEFVERAHLQQPPVIKLALIHFKLTESIVTINECYGPTVLIIIISCLLHLVITPFFWIAELEGRHDSLCLGLFGCWIGAYIGRLFLIVEPCQGVTREQDNTSRLICKLLGTYDANSEIRRQVELFAMQLLHARAEFSACGLVSINRRLLTGIAGVVTTYLVILMQFQKN